MDLGLHRRRAIVTGGSRGIGRAVAEALIAEGATVAICGRTAESLDAARAALGEKCLTSVVDANDHEALGAWVRDSAQAMGGLDIVISNVSALGGVPRSAEGWRRNFEVDVLSSVTLVDEALPWLRLSDAASIVQLGTITAVEYHGFPGGGFSYGAMKAALVNYISQLAMELASEGIRANTVSPGPIFISGGSWDYIQRKLPDYYAENVAHQPSGRLGSPEEVARVVAFLASPAASWVTGENVIVDGGFTRRHAF
jgi:NAD(P)-dependent dehydrogenase (short-subunit alcohol dehydrogenase family)